MENLTQDFWKSKRGKEIVEIAIKNWNVSIGYEVQRLFAEDGGSWDSGAINAFMKNAGLEGVLTKREEEAWETIIQKIAPMVGINLWASEKRKTKEEDDEG